MFYGLNMTKITTHGLNVDKDYWRIRVQITRLWDAYNLKKTIKPEVFIWFCWKNKLNIHVIIYY